MSSASKRSNKYLQNTELALQQLKNHIVDQKSRIVNKRGSSPKSKQQVLQKYINFVEEKKSSSRNNVSNSPSKVPSNIQSLVSQRLNKTYTSAQKLKYGANNTDRADLSPSSNYKRDVTSTNMNQGYTTTRSNQSGYIALSSKRSYENKYDFRSRLNDLKTEGQGDRNNDINYTGLDKFSKTFDAKRTGTQESQDQVKNEGSNLGIYKQRISLKIKDQGGLESVLLNTNSARFSRTQSPPLENYSSSTFAEILNKSRMNRERLRNGESEISNSNSEPQQTFTDNKLRQFLNEQAKAEPPQLKKLNAYFKQENTFSMQREESLKQFSFGVQQSNKAQKNPNDQVNYSAMNNYYIPKPKRYKRNDLAFQLNKSSVRPSDMLEFSKVISGSNVSVPRLLLNNSFERQETSTLERTSRTYRDTEQNLASFASNSVIESPFEKQVLDQSSSQSKTSPSMTLIRRTSPEPEIKNLVLDKEMQEDQFKEEIQQGTWDQIKLNPLKHSDFEFGTLLGEGTFGSVYLARHHSSGYLVAIKKLSKLAIKMKRAENRVVNELRIQTALTHPNIIDFYGHFHDDQDIFFVLELASEGNLYDLVKKEYPNGKVPEKVVKEILKQLLQGIKYLHQNDFAHRDLKPENILVSLGVVKISDFGCCTCTKGVVRETFCGTRDYQSPEMLMKTEHGLATDIWSFGAISYELLTGKVPHVNREQPIADLELSRELSDEAKEFLKSCLIFDVRQRKDINHLIQHEFLRF